VDASSLARPKYTHRARGLHEDFHIPFLFLSVRGARRGSLFKSAYVRRSAREEFSP
jgi:hypothetical protein